MRAQGLVISLAVAVVSWAAPAWADAGPDLREGDRAMDSLDYGRAVAAFERVTTNREATAEELVHAYAALVRCHVVLGNEASARLAAEQLLETDPEARLEGGNIPPRVSRFFDEFRRGYTRTTETVVSIDMPDRLESGRGVDVFARVTRGRRGVASLRLVVRFADDTPVIIEMTPQGRMWTGRMQVPATFDPSVMALRYWVEARAPSGAVLGGLGSEDEEMVMAPLTGQRTPTGPDPQRDPDIVPRRDPIEHRPGRHGDDRDDGTPVTGRWWFWTGVVALVAGGVIAALVLTDEGKPAPPGSNGTWPLP